MTELRVVRAAVVAVLSSAVSVAAHAAAGGGMHDLGSTLLLTLMIAGAATAIADRRHGAARTVAILATAQLSQHVMLTWLSGLAHHDAHYSHPAMIAALLPRLSVSLPMPAERGNVPHRAGSGRPLEDAV